MKIRTNDGFVFEGYTATDLVAQLAASSFADSNSDWQWMDESAKRASEQLGVPFRSDTAEHYIEDLIKNGLATDVTNAPADIILEPPFHEDKDVKR